MSSDLNPITPEQAKDLYNDEYEEKRSYESLRKARSVLDTFVEWTEQEGLENMNEIDGRQLQEMKMWWKRESDTNNVSLNGYLAVVRRFLVFCERIEVVSENTPDRMPQASIDEDEEVCDRKPDDEAVEAISAYFHKYDRASRRHIEFALPKELTIRLGALVSIDEDDYYPDEQKIELRHRPEEEYGGKGTPLKNGSDGERNINVPSHLCELINEYLEHPERNGEGTDKFGRKPLLRNRNGGRPSTTTVRRDLYKMTRPCAFSNECPQNRDINECDAAKDSMASECPVNYSPHPIRRWSIEDHLDDGVPREDLADRADVSVPVLDKHYDRRSKERKRQRRMETLAATREGYETSDGDSQMSLSQFENGPNAVAHPVAFPVQIGVEIGAWIPDRLSRELNELSPSDGISTPDATTAAKGMVTYSMMVCMVALNLALLAS
ncbi:hypothetical protein [Halorubrum sp. SS7]|uniref:tyrosine-type recombinase/integrase n=1 Tax=Halorubrum sp. SS7 TaxID=2518119 RepID=UPI001F544723|nr:hypothetical protein [Halorubrum sp. SS7]